MPSFSKKRISAILTAIAGGLWVHSIIFAEPKVGFYGLLNSFPITLFVGLGFLTVATVILWVSKEYHPKLLFCQLLLLISALWLAPAIVGGSAPFTNHALRSLGLVEYIARTGDITASAFHYLSWPAVFALPALMVRVFSVDFEPMLNYAPFIMQLLYLLPLYVFLRNTLGDDRRNYCWVGMWMFYLASWTGYAYFASAPSLGLLLLLVLLALVTRPSLWKGEGRYYALWAPIVAVYGLLVATHLMMSVVALCILGGIALLKRSKKVVRTAGICLALLVIWNLTWALPSTRVTLGLMDVVAPSDEVIEVTEIEAIDVLDIEAGEVPIVEAGEVLDIEVEGVAPIGDSGRVFVGEIIEIPQRPVSPGEGRNILLGPSLIADEQITSHLSGSESHIAVVEGRMLLSVIFVALGIAGVVVALINKGRRKIAIMILVIAVAPLILVVFSYAGRMMDRLYLVSLIPMAYFGANLFAIKKRAVIIGLCALLVACCPLHFIAHYGNQEYDYVSPDQMAGLHYFHENTSTGYVFSLDPPWLMENLESFHYVPFWALTLEDNKIVVPTSRGDRPSFFLLTRQQRVYYEFVLGEPDFVGEVEELLGRIENCELVYDNPDFKIWEINREGALDD